MGVYDTVIVPCPNCGEEDYFQTKSGPCELRSYALADAPADVMENVNRHAPACCRKCGTFFAVHEETRRAYEVP